MALVEVVPPQRSYRISCDAPACTHTVQVAATSELSALFRVVELHFWRVASGGQFCTAHALDTKRADASFAPALAAYSRDGGVSIAARQEGQG